MQFNYSENDTYISINEGIYTPYGYLNVIDSASLLFMTPLELLKKLSKLNIILFITSHYTKYAVVRVNQKAVNDNTIRLRPTFNDRKECPLQQILLSSDLIDYIKNTPDDNNDQNNDDNENNNSDNNAENNENNSENNDNINENNNEEQNNKDINP